MKYLYNIEDVAKECSLGQDVVFCITSTNKYTLFLFPYFQLKYKTLKEFHHISYQKEKDLLYYFLKCCAKVSLGKYILSFDFKEENNLF